ncbi:hypothetical protein FB451DRAFT_1174601 [Mycena latifolia]|nr:hypothetical protein FB451DRAFT_1174601 [Mycena latifolia]
MRGAPSARRRRLRNGGGDASWLRGSGCIDAQEGYVYTDPGCRKKKKKKRVRGRRRGPRQGLFTLGGRRAATSGRAQACRGLGCSGLGVDGWSWRRRGGVELSSVQNQRAGPAAYGAAPVEGQRVPWSPRLSGLEAGATMFVQARCSYGGQMRRKRLCIAYLARRRWPRDGVRAPWGVPDESPRWE